MRFREFMRDRAVYIALYALFGWLTVAVTQLDLALTQSITGASLLYVWLLGMAGLALFLLHDYNRQRGFWRRFAAIRPDTELDQLGLLPDPRSLEQELYSQAWQALYARLRAELTEEQQRGRRNLHLVSQWAHHMKTPVAVIDLELQKARRQANPELQKARRQSELEPVLMSVAEENQRLGRLLQTLLNAIRLEEFEADFQVGPVDLAELVRHLVNDHKREFIIRRVYPRVEIEPGVILQSDGKWLRFVLEQVLSNAIKYTSSPEREGLVRFCCRQTAAETVLEVSDNGIGIPSEDLGRVFAPFYTGATGRGYPQSTGMGLYLARETCRRLGHRIEIDSRPGEGTTIRLRFPADRTLFADLRPTLTER